MNPYKMVVAVANQKGGCAKTTTAVNLAAALAKGNQKFKVPPAKPVSYTHLRAHETTGQSPMPASA